MSTWPHCEKSKSLIQLVSDCEMTAFGIEEKHHGLQELILIIL